MRKVIYIECMYNTYIGYTRIYKQARCIYTDIYMDTYPRMYTHIYIDVEIY